MFLSFAKYLHTNFLRAGHVEGELFQKLEGKTCNLT